MFRRWAYDPSFPRNYNLVKVAHGVLGILAWVVFFPLGSILLRTLDRSRHAVRIHYLIQTWALAVFVVAAGTGVWMAGWIHELNTTHAIIGLVMLAVAVLQALAGTIQHIFHKRGREMWPLARIHVWVGRILITLGIINGGLGLQLDGASTQAENIAYGVIAGFIWMVFMYVAFFRRGSKGPGPRSVDGVVVEKGFRHMDGSDSPPAQETWNDPRCTCGIAHQDRVIAQKDAYVIGRPISHTYAGPTGRF